MLFRNKQFVLKQAKAFKYTICILNFIVETILGWKMTDYEKKNVTPGRGGGQKSAQKVSRIIYLLITAKDSCPHASFASFYGCWKTNIFTIKCVFAIPVSLTSYIISDPGRVAKLFTAVPTSLWNQN